MRSFVRLRVQALLLLSYAAGCGGDGPGTNPNARSIVPGLHVIAGASLTDTVDAVSSQAMVVQLADAAGTPLSGVTVRMNVGTVTVTSPFTTLVATMSLSPISANQWTGFVSSTTDTAGKVHVLTRMAAYAGPGFIVINAPTLGLVDTARFTIRPGNGTRITTSPRDTMVYVGGIVKPRIAVTDRYGNALSLAPVVASARARVSIATDGSLAGAAIGRDVLSISSGTLRDSLLVSVVPTGTMAAYTWMRGSGDPLAIYTFNLDGSGFRKLVSTLVFDGYFGEMPPVWSIDGRTIFYHDNKSNHTKMLWSVDAASGVSQRLVRPTEQMGDERFPSRSADGRWIYFNGPDYGISAAYRVRVDGTGVELAGLGGLTQSFPHPSPDGTSILYTAAGRIEVMNLTTKVITRLGIPATVARWSPSGALIAYRDDNVVRVSRPDGTSLKTLYNGYTPQYIDWSTDGKYVLVSIDGTITLIDVATGEMLPLKVSAVSHGLTSPSMKP